MGKRKKSRIEILAEITERATAAAERGRAEAIERRRRVSQANQAKLTEWHAKRRADVAKAKAAANRAARIAADPKRTDRRRLDKPGWQVLLERMEAGRWYAQGELVALGAPDYARGSVAAWLLQRLVPEHVERAPNADYDAAKAGRRQVEPQWLYRKRDSRGS